MKKALFKLMIFIHRLIKAVANRILDKNFIRPRNFSNVELRKYSRYFSGSVINVSGWRDADGEGGHYREYFTNARDYFVSNISGQGKGFGSAGSAYKEIELDLTKDLPINLKNSFDVVFNHTTLEHIFEFRKAFQNLCMLSRDVVIIVVPVMQQIHHTTDFGDYWRPTTMAIAKLFLENGFKPLVLKCNEQPFAPIYCFAIAARNPGKYESSIKKSVNYEMGSHNYGSSLKAEYIPNILENK